MTDKKTNKIPGLRITAQQDGFRRAGRAWHGVTELPAAKLNKKQLAVLKADPKIVVEEIDIEAGD